MSNKYQDLIERLEAQYTKTNFDYEKKLSPGRELWKEAAQALRELQERIEVLERVRKAANEFYTDMVRAGCLHIELECALKAAEDE